MSRYESEPNSNPDHSQPERKSPRPNRRPLRAALGYLASVSLALLAYAGAGTAEVSGQKISTNESPRVLAKPPIEKPETQHSKELREKIKGFNAILSTETQPKPNRTAAESDQLSKLATDRKAALKELLNEDRSIDNELLPNANQITKSNPRLAGQLEQIIDINDAQVLLRHEDKLDGSYKDTAELVINKQAKRFHNQKTNSVFLPGQTVDLKQAAQIDDHIVAADSINTQAAVIKNGGGTGVPSSQSETRVIYYTSPGETVTSTDRTRINNALAGSDSAQSWLQTNLFGQFTGIAVSQNPNVYPLDPNLCYNSFALYQDILNKEKALGYDTHFKDFAVVIKDNSLCNPGAYTQWGLSDIGGYGNGLTVYVNQIYWDNSVFKHEKAHEQAKLHHASTENSEYALYDGLMGNSWVNTAKFNKLEYYNINIYNSDQILSAFNAGDYEISCRWNDAYKQLVRIPVNNSIKGDLWFSCLKDEIGAGVTNRPAGYGGVNAHWGINGLFQKTFAIDLKQQDGEESVAAEIGKNYQFTDSPALQWMKVLSVDNDRAVVRVAQTAANLENTPTPTATKTSTPTNTPTNTPTPTETATNTPTPTKTATSTPTPTATATETATNTPTSTHTPTATATLKPGEPTNTTVPATATKQPATPTEITKPTSTATKQPVVTPIETQTPSPSATNTPKPDFPNNRAGSFIVIPIGFNAAQPLR